MALFTMFALVTLALVVAAAYAEPIKPPEPPDDDFVLADDQGPVGPECPKDDCIFA